VTFDMHDTCLKITCLNTDKEEEEEYLFEQRQDTIRHDFWLYIYTNISHMFTLI